MVHQKITVGSEHGIHMRVAGKIVQEANRFHCEIMLKKDGLQTNCKSILGIISLAIRHAETIELTADGEDESQAMKALVDLF